MTQNVFKEKLVRRVVEKGTKIIEEPSSPISFMDDKAKHQNAERLELAGDLWIMSAKGTSKIKLSEMKKTESPDLKGVYISTGKGTGRRKL